MKGSEESARYSILIADDDRNSRAALREIFEREGYSALCASCGEEAVEIVQQSPVDLAMLDMNMPTLTGLETLELVRQIRAFLPAILVTGDPSERVIQQAYQAHVFSVIPKPISRKVVLYTVVKALSKRPRQRQTPDSEQERSS